MADQEQERSLASWRAAFAQERWFLIARGWGDQVTPYAVEIDGEGVIAVFTTPERARDFGLASGLEPAEASALIAVPREAAVGYLVQFAEDGVHAVVLDPGIDDSAVMLAALPHVEQLSLREEDASDGGAVVGGGGSEDAVGRDA
ncbi:hypothetical protein C8046_03925 [Serinibacter arcticus]|uniref:SseB protein N-terminal domain-containing protein n=1 Tax=Serinibacter arcticus TaxID=1655435 RepID=A0A2U1ZSJ2_9MICO|nr:hypothetical protein [Serinibacter arcticus]PWD49954.1 hypothetical protein C8046_03925 [Serinibacter arcticus]